MGTNLCHRATKRWISKAATKGTNKVGTNLRYRAAKRWISKAATRGTNKVGTNLRYRAAKRWINKAATKGTNTKVGTNLRQRHRALEGKPLHRIKLPDANIAQELFRQREAGVVVFLFLLCLLLLLPGWAQLGFEQDSYQHELHHARDKGQQLPTGSCRHQHPVTAL